MKDLKRNDDIREELGISDTNVMIRYQKLSNNI
jgi:hypothetical protein